MTGRDGPNRSPVVLRYEDTWDKLGAQLAADREVGLTASAVRSEVEAWLDAGTFNEIGTLVRRGTSSYQGGDSGGEASNDVPADGLIAGWGTRQSQPVFVVADDPDLGSPIRGGAGAAKATRIRAHASAQCAPLVQVLSAGRIEPGAFIGAEFARFGYGVDLDWEAAAAERFPKIAIVTGSLIDQAAIEASWCHLVILAGPAAAIDGRAGPEALGRGLADAAVEDLAAGLALAGAALQHLPPSRFEPAPVDVDTPVRGPKRTPPTAARDVLDSGWQQAMSPQWHPSVGTTLGTLEGRTVAAVDWPPELEVTSSRLTKVERIVALARALGLPLIVAHAGLDRSATPTADDVEAVDRLRHALATCTTPVVEVAFGRRHLQADLGVRPLVVVDAGRGAGGDARTTPDGLRAELAATLGALTVERPRWHDDPRVASAGRRTLQGGSG